MTAQGNSTQWAAARPGFESVGGLDDHIRCLKELVLFPLMYKELYTCLHMKPPRGVLFYGPPGTGKTLVAGALASECSQGERRVAFISRKGADCYSKYVGESEQRLRSLFEEARAIQPAIIFFDEIDGLAPTRSSRHDVVHTSVVGTLLALMDGLDSYSDVIVIGATNRIDAIDPALRRPGRFDKELFFPLPSYKARVEILKVHLRHWRQKLSDGLLEHLASCTVGYCGSDLQALCSEAMLSGIRRAYPDIYACKKKMKINLSSLMIDECDIESALRRVVASSQRVLCCPVQRLAPALRPLLQSALDRAVQKLLLLHPKSFLFPDLDNNVVESAISIRCPSLLLVGNACQGHTDHIAPALLHHFEHLPVTVIDIGALFELSSRGTEEACISKMRQVRQALPGVLFLPDITSWWCLVNEATRTVFLTLAQRLDHKTPLLMLGTANGSFKDLPRGLRQLWGPEERQVLAMVNPSAAEREEYFRQLLLEVALAPYRAPPPPNTVPEEDETPESLPNSSSQSSDSPSASFNREPDDDDSVQLLSSANFPPPKVSSALLPNKPTPNGRTGRRRTRTSSRLDSRSRSRSSLRAVSCCSPELPRRTSPRFSLRRNDQEHSLIRAHRQSWSEHNPHHCGSDHNPEAGPSEMKIDVPGLHLLLQRIVNITEDKPFRTLESLHASLASIVNRYCRLTDRGDMVRALTVAVDVFEQQARSRSASTS